MTTRTRTNAIGGALRGFLRREDGAAAVYVSIMIALLVGFVGLAVDFGRFYTTNSEAQNAADAAALAAATQLDGESDSIARAILAAQTSPLVANDQTFAEGDATIQIADIRFLHSLPPSDSDPITDAYVTTVSEEAAYVEVWTEQLLQKNVFLSAVGAGSGTTRATAVAGYNNVLCQIPPLMMCNPYEDPGGGGSFPAALLKGKTILAKTKEGGIDSWAPGDMGLLDPPQYDWDTKSNTGAKQVAEEIAKSAPPQCFGSPVTIRPGQVDAMRNAVNVRFDIYQNPFFGSGKARKNSEFRPARNVTKGMISEWVTTVDPVTGATTSSCEQTESPTTMALPPDNCFGPDFSNPSSCEGLSGVPAGFGDRIGNGVWNLETYWSINHPDWVTANGKAIPDELVGAGRYDVYRYEIKYDMIPGAGQGGPENGVPVCYGGSTAPNDYPDRRIIPVGVINCIEENLLGGSNEDVDVLDYYDMFIIRPIRGGSDTSVWLELRGKTGDCDDPDLPCPEIEHDMVQLYR